MRYRKAASLLAAAMIFASASGAYAGEIALGGQETVSPVMIIDEESSSDQETADIGMTEAEAGDDAETEAETTADALIQGRSLLSQMEHYVSESNEEAFSKLFAEGIGQTSIDQEYGTVRDIIKAADGLNSHADICFSGPSAGGGDSEDGEYYAVGLTDYRVNADGTVDWYSTLLRIVKVGEDWKIARMPENSLLSEWQPAGYKEAAAAGRGAEDLYPYLALRYSKDTVFDGAFYSLANMAWENEDGSISVALWIANGTSGSKWCDSVDLTLTSGDTQIASANVPVQIESVPGTGSLTVVTIPEDSAEASGASWSGISVQSNLHYE